jgi:subtilisin family serine protease
MLTEVIRRVGGTRLRPCALGLLLALAVAGLGQDASAAPRRFPKLDAELEHRAIAGSSLRQSRVIVTLAPGAVLPASLRKYDRKGRLDVINGYVLDVPDSVLAALSTSATVSHVHADRAIYAQNFRTGITSGSFFVRQNLGYTGAGVEVAVIDSGIALHDDLPNVVVSMNFLDGNPNPPPTDPHDDFGHGTAVAGIIAGNGFDSGGKLAGAAPGANLVSLKVLDANGDGFVSDVIAALNWVAAHYNTDGRHIRVVNLSIGAPVTESYTVDPLTLAAREVVRKGVTVVAAAGNGGRDDRGHKVHGFIAAPGNAPWVLTVGASSTEATLTRKDDTMAPFSSLGPTMIDRAAKPDLVASGVGTESTTSFEGSLYTTNAAFLLPGTIDPGYLPYMSLSGTSVSTPAVSGAVALMLQANPTLTPNLIKAILQYTAEFRHGYGPLEQGAGFLNTLGAVRLAAFYATPHTKHDTVPTEALWSEHIFWGNDRLTGGFMRPSANAWGTGVTWGSAKTLGDHGDNIVWGTARSGDNIVWGTVCGGGDCGDNIVWGTAFGGDNIVWGTTSGDNIVWGTSDGDSIVWGTAKGVDTLVWGTSDGGNIVSDSAKPHKKPKRVKKNPSYEWFLDPAHDAWWIRHEFGHSFVIRPGKHR